MRRAPALLPLLLLALLASPRPAAGGRPALLAASGQARLELADGTVAAVALPEGVELATTAALGRGWIAAGTRTAGDRESLFLLSGEGGAVSALPEPPGQRGRLRQRPVPFVAGDRLAGLAWLEGDDVRSFTVRAALWDGTHWRAPRTVAGRGAGSQLALSGAVLEDGSWLLAWSAFDGEDDEVYWSRGSSQGLTRSWSPPRRVAADNRVPDITPALTASGDGAIAAWSRFDGADYRLVVARFAAGRWSAPEVVGPAGSGFPSFEAAVAPAVGPCLLYRTAAPRTWSLLALDSSGRPLARVVVATPESLRPLVAGAADGSTVTLRWPASEARLTLRWEPMP